MLGKNFSTLKYFLFFFRNRIRQIRIVSLNDDLLGMSNPIFWENMKNIINLFSAEFCSENVNSCPADPGYALSLLTV